MAEIVRYVNAASSGGDGTTNATSGANAAYASLSAWDAAEQTNLVTDGDTHLVWCEGSTDDTTLCTVDGWTTDATHFITIKTAGAHRHAGVWDGSAFVIDTGTNTLGLQILDGHTVVDGLQINVGRTSGVTVVLSPEGSDAPVTLINNICRYDATGSIVKGIQDGSTAWNHIVANNLVYDMSGDGMFFRGDVADMAVYNNTIVGCAVGLHARDTGGTATITAKNNLIFNCTDEYYDQAGFTADSEFNASETVGEPPGTNPVEITEAGTSLFVDYTNDDYHIVASTTVAGAGVDLSTDSDGLYSFSTDIDGETRSAWDIGADEITVAAGITGTSATTNANDSQAASGTLETSGSAATTNAGDTQAAAGELTNSGSSATTNANDSQAANGTLEASGSSASTNANDSQAAAGTLEASGVSAAINANDNQVASGIVGAILLEPGQLFTASLPLRTFKATQALHAFKAAQPLRTFKAAI